MLFNVPSYSLSLSLSLSLLHIVVLNTGKTKRIRFNVLSRSLSLSLSLFHILSLTVFSATDMLAQARSIFNLRLADEQSMVPVGCKAETPL